QLRLERRARAGQRLAERVEPLVGVGEPGRGGGQAGQRGEQRRLLRAVGERGQRGARERGVGLHQRGHAVRAVERRQRGHARVDGGRGAGQQRGAAGALHRLRQRRQRGGDRGRVAGGV